MKSVLSHKIIPVLTADEPELAIAAVAALQEGGMTCVEVALRTPNALEVLNRVVHAFPEMQVGAGTVREAADFTRVIDAGAQFAVSPGTTPQLLQEARRWDIEYLPAAATVSEMLVIREAGFRAVKVFPAAALGGADFLYSISAPLSDMQFVPSGGIGLSHLPQYFEVATVVSVSGSWMLPSAAMSGKAWSDVTSLARQTLEMI